MTPNGRIAWNVAATYGRSLVALACGLLSGRWVLMTLGEIDYGILGLVGGLVAFVTFLNGMLSGAVARFYALSVGRGALDDCRRWFTVALSLHTAIPVALTAVGYPLGAHAICHWLTIPSDRIADAIWVWRFACVGSFATMVCVPFNAMFVARQRFGELSLYGILVTVLNAGVLYFMVTHPGAWLVRLSAYLCLLTTLQMAVVAIRACAVFDECRIVRAHLFSGRDIRELGGFVGWMALGGFGTLLRGSGMTVLVNKLFGPTRNAALAVANTVSDQAASLWGAILAAFQPAITTACGEGDFGRMETLSNAACKFGVLLLLPFTVPLSLEIETVLGLWLGRPPEGAAGLCVLVMAAAAVDRTATGLWAVLDAKGRLEVSKPLAGLAAAASLVLAWAFVKCGCGLNGIGWALCLSAAMSAAVEVVLSGVLAGLSPIRWLGRIALPLGAAAAVSVAAGCLPRLWLAPSFPRVCVTAAAANLALGLMGWLFVLDAAERETVRNWIRGKRFGK